jgi:hypothetical protein
MNYSQLTLSIRKKAAQWLRRFMGFGCFIIHTFECYSDIHIDIKRWLFSGTGVWPQGFGIAYQDALLFEPHFLALFCFLLLFLDGILCFCPGLTLDSDPPTYASPVAGMTGTCHHAWYIDWDGTVLLTFCLSWLWTAVLPDFCLSSSWHYRSDPLHQARLTF